MKLNMEEIIQSSKNNKIGYNVRSKLGSKSETSLRKKVFVLCFYFNKTSD